MGMFNLFVHRGLWPRRRTYAFGRNHPVHLSSKNTILKIYDGTFKNIFEKVFKTESRTVRGKGLMYEHRLIDDMAASNLKRNGGNLWAREER